MYRRPSLIALFTLFTLLIAACRVDPGDSNTPGSTPPSELSAQCFTTKAYGNEHLVVVVGQDVVPTAFDAINGGGCTFNDFIVELRVTLSRNGKRHPLTIDLTTPTTDISLPLDPVQGIPTLPESLAAGRYEREVVAVADDGREVILQGVEPVILVFERDTAQANLLRAQSRWERTRLHAYTYTAVMQCFCLQEYNAAVRVEVLDGQVISVAFVNSSKFSGEVPAPERFKTIDDLFAVVWDAYDTGAYSVRSVYDDQYGFPVDVFIDYELMMADEEHGFIVSDLRFKLR